MTRWGRWLWLAVALCLWPGAAHAQELLGKNVHYFKPVVDDGGVLWTYGSEPLGMWRMHYGAYVDDAIRPVNFLENDGDLRTIVVNQVSAQALFSVGLFNVANLGFALPFVAYRQISDETRYDDLDAYAFEDLRIDGKWSFLNRKQKCLGIGLMLRVNVPIAPTENSFSSDQGVSLLPAVVFDLGRRWWTVAANLGYKYYSNPGGSDEFNLDVGDELALNAGAVFRVSRTQQVLVDSATRTLARAPFGNPDLDYSEVALAYRKYWKRLNFTALTAGVGAGLLSGVGDPTLRIFIGVTRDERRLGPGDDLF